MNIDQYREIADLFYKYAIRGKEATHDFLEFSFSKCVDPNNINSFSEIAEELLNRTDDETVYQYLITTYNGLNEQGLAQIIAMMPIDFSEEIINMATAMSADTSPEGKINLNTLLLRFISDYEKGSVSDYEGKINSIIRCMNNSAKEQRELLRSKEKEVLSLRARLSDAINAEKAIATIKGPLTELERYIALSTHRKNKSVLRLIEISNDFRCGIEQLYGIKSVESIEHWRMQQPVPYDPVIHQLVEKPDYGTENLEVYVETLGFMIPGDGDGQVIIRAEVSVSESGKAY